MLTPVLDKFLDIHAVIYRLIIAKVPAGHAVHVPADGGQQGVQSASPPRQNTAPQTQALPGRQGISVADPHTLS